MATSPVTNVSPAIFAGILPPFAWKENRAVQPATLRTAQPTPSPATAAVASCTATREEILLANLPLVRFVARSIHERLPQHVELEDLVSAGTVGLIDALNKFDTAKNTQFRSYAQFRIRGAILDSLRSLDWGSRELRRKGRSIEDASQSLTRQLNRRPSEPEIAAELKIGLEEYQELLGDLRRLEITSLQELHAEGSVEEELAYVPTAPEEDPLYLCMKSEAAWQLSAAIAELPEREARVLALYYVEEMTLKEIGGALGLVESRISQIRVAAVVALRARLGKTNRTGAPGKLLTIPAAVMEKRATARSKPTKSVARGLPVAAASCSA
ncbi:MAG: FliA/WhiG family RNA polymerase sigma factor [Acidobacteriaceae bacterium]